MTLEWVLTGAAGAVHEEARLRLLEMKQAALKDARQMVTGLAVPTAEARQLKPGDQIEFRKRVGSYLGGWFAGRILQVRCPFLDMANTFLRTAWHTSQIMAAESMSQDRPLMMLKI